MAPYCSASTRLTEREAMRAAADLIARTVDAVVLTRIWESVAISRKATDVPENPHRGAGREERRREEHWRGWERKAPRTTTRTAEPSRGHMRQTDGQVPQT
jgi:hypothetical protein